MTIYYINTGTSANKGDGDSIRSAFTKVNYNFGELEGRLDNLTVPWEDIEGVPSPPVTINLGGNLTGSTSSHITNLSSGTFSITGDFVETIFHGTNTNTLLSPNRRRGSFQTWTANNVFRLNTPSYLAAGQHITLAITQDNVGNRAMIPNSSYKWIGNNTVLSTTPGVTDYITVFYDGISLYANLQSGSGGGGGGGASITVGASAPVGVSEGALWWDTTDGRAYIYYDFTWVDLSPPIDIAFNAISTSIIPAEDQSYDLGSTSSQWRSLYVSSSTIYVGGKSLTIDDTGTLLVEGAPITGGGGGGNGYTGSAGYTGSSGYIGSMGYTGSYGAGYDQDLNTTNTVIFKSVGIDHQSLGYNSFNFPGTPLSIDVDEPNYTQTLIKNYNTGTTATSDIMILNDQGDAAAAVNLLDIGINSSNYSQAEYGIHTPGSGYMFTNGVDLLIGTQTPGTKLYFHAGGTTSTNAGGHLDETAWEFNRPILLREAKNGELIFSTQNPSPEAGSGAVYQGINANSSYFKLGINGPNTSEGNIQGNETFLYSSGLGDTIHFGNRSTINFYANTSTGFYGTATLSLNHTDQSANFAGDLLPITDSQQNLGSPTYQWGSLYVSTATIYIGGNAVSVDSSGTLTVNAGVVGGVGYVGSQGNEGPTGPGGAEGPTGPQGYTGSVGNEGPTGPGGAEGPTGPQGYTGSVGNEGPTGPGGSEGPTGPQGYTGSSGSNGAVGYTGSAGSAYVRNSISTTTSVLANGTTATIDVSAYKTYVLQKIVTSTSSWVRIYSDSTSRTNDNTRTQGTDPTPGSGVIAEVITTSTGLTQLITPGVIGFNNDVSPSSQMYLSVTNVSGASSAVTVTITLLQLE